jgi:hypothetical protein
LFLNQWGRFINKKRGEKNKNGGERQKNSENQVTLDSIFGASKKALFEKLCLIYALEPNDMQFIFLSSFPSLTKPKHWTPELQRQLAVNRGDRMLVIKNANSKLSVIHYSNMACTPGCNISRSMIYSLLYNVSK